VYEAFWDRVQGVSIWVVFSCSLLMLYFKLFTTEKPIHGNYISFPRRSIWSWHHYYLQQNIHNEQQNTHAGIHISSKPWLLNVIVALLRQRQTLGNKMPWYAYQLHMRHTVINNITSEKFGANYERKSVQHLRVYKWVVVPSAKWNSRSQSGQTSSNVLQRL